jgi:hypothetical protein
MTECPKCKSSKVAAGRLVINGHSAQIAAAFIPGTVKWYQFSMEGGAPLQNQAFACPDCGFVWAAALYPDKLRDILNRFPSTGKESA